MNAHRASGHYQHMLAVENIMLSVIVVCLLYAN